MSLGEVGGSEEGQLDRLEAFLVGWWMAVLPHNSGAVDETVVGETDTGAAVGEIAAAGVAVAAPVVVAPTSEAGHF